jgi:UDP-2-acetamido-2-deoxy-ribo-hexuluronate aminotransferase
MDTLQCAVVLAKLERFEWELARRHELGARYGRLLRAAGIAPPVVRGDRDCVWAQYTVQVERRAQVQQALQAAGIPTAVHYPRPLHQQPAYAAFAGTACPPAFPNSEAAAQRVLSLPMSADLGEAQQDAVVHALRAAIEG